MVPGSSSSPSVIGKKAAAYRETFKDPRRLARRSLEPGKGLLPDPKDHPRRAYWTRARIDEHTHAKGCGPRSAERRKLRELLSEGVSRDPGF